MRFALQTRAQQKGFGEKGRERERETDRGERETGRQDRACCESVQRRTAPRTGSAARLPVSRRHYYY